MSYFVRLGHTEDVDGLNITVRKATTDDMRIIWEWRNDPVTRAMFRESEPIPWSQHEKWFKSVMADSKRLLLMADANDEPCGIVRFDGVDDGRAEVSVNIAPKYRGFGVGSIALELATKEALARGWKNVLAMIKPENLTSRKAFSKAGYTWIGERGDYVVMMAKGA